MSDEREKIQEIEHEVMLTGVDGQELCPCGCGYPKGMMNNPPGRNCKLINEKCGYVSELIPRFEVEPTTQVPSYETDRDAPREEGDVIGKWHCDLYLDVLAGLELEEACTLISMERSSPTAKATDKWYDWVTRDGIAGGCRSALPNPLRLFLTYPLGTTALVTVEPMIDKTTYTVGDGRVVEDEKLLAGYFAWVLAHAYRKIYEDHETYGIWGHAIGDLVLERVEIHKNGDCDISIGS